MKKITTLGLSLVLLGISSFGFAQNEAEKTFNYAQELYQAKEFETAIAQYLKVATLDAPNEYEAEAYYMVGECLAAQRQQVQWAGMTALETHNLVYDAIEQWNKVIEKYPNSAAAGKAKEKIKISQLYVQSKERPYYKLEDLWADLMIGEGIGYLDRAAKVTEYGTVYERREFDKGLYWFDKVIELYPDSDLAAKAQYNKGEAYCRMDRPEDYRKAVEEHWKVVENYPGTIWAKRSITRIGDICQYNLGDKTQALKAYQKGIEIAEFGDLDTNKIYCETQISILK